MGRGPGRGEGIEKARSAQNPTPVLAAVDRFARRVLEDLSPSDPAAPLFEALRKPGVSLERDEVEARVIAEQERLEAWLRETFEEMARGLPASKKVLSLSSSFLDSAASQAGPPRKGHAAGMYLR